MGTKLDVRLHLAIQPVSIGAREPSAVWCTKKTLSGCPETVKRFLWMPLWTGRLEVGKRL